MSQEHEPVRILALGDSLTAGYGLAPEFAYPKQIENLLRADGFNVSMVNGGVSGDTAAQGLARLDWLLAGFPDGGPDLVILELGANDGLRGEDAGRMRSALDAIIQRLKERGARIILMGMIAMANYGPEYRQDYDAVFPELAEKHDLPLYPFFLKDVAGVPELNQYDGLHPNEEGTRLVAENTYPLIREQVEAILAGREGSL